VPAEVIAETKISIGHLRDNEGQERLEEETMTTEPVADPQQDESNTPPMVDQCPEVSPKQIEDATSSEEVTVAAMEGRCLTDATEASCVESELVVDITQVTAVDGEMPVEVIVETKFDSDQFGDNEGPLILEEETITTEQVADSQQDEYNPPMVDHPPEISPEQIENASSAEEGTVAVMGGRCSADSIEEYCVEL
jgi:hypothetical protein